jgi:hypothetical protein
MGREALLGELDLDRLHRALVGRRLASEVAVTKESRGYDHDDCEELHPVVYR